MYFAVNVSRETFQTYMSIIFDLLQIRLRLNLVKCNTFIANTFTCLLLGNEDLY